MTPCSKTESSSIICRPQHKETPACPTSNSNDAHALPQTAQSTVVAAPLMHAAIKLNVADSHVPRQQCFLYHYYERIYGATRFYCSLLPALLLPTRHVALRNPFVSDQHFQRSLAAIIPSLLVPLDWLPPGLDCLMFLDTSASSASLKETNNDNAQPLSTEMQTCLDMVTNDGSTSYQRFPPPLATLLTSSPSLAPYYLLDPASLLPALALKVSKHHQVLDLCAAPGGKTFALFQLMFASDLSSSLGKSHCGKLTSNEFSAIRSKRLQSIIREYIPSSLRSRITVKQKSALDKKSFVKGSFDRILLDAPCSSERHLLHQATSIQTFSAQRTRQHAETQLLMLINAISWLKAGGRLVYSTCSLSPEENDGVIEKALKMCPDMQQEAFTSAAIGSRTRCGACIILPDDEKIRGFGPLFFCVLTKSIAFENLPDSDNDTDDD